MERLANINVLYRITLPSYPQHLSDVEHVVPRTLFICIRPDGHTLLNLTRFIQNITNIYISLNNLL